MKRLVMILGLVVALPCCGDDPSEPAAPSEPVAVERCYELAEKLKLYGFDRRKKECELGFAQYWYDERRMCWLTRITGPGHNGDKVQGLKEPVHGSLFDFELHKESKELLSLGNYYLALLSWEEETVAVREPILSKEEATEQAKSYIKTIGTKMNELVLVSAIYDEHVLAAGKVWRIGFSRQLKGYRFKNDYVNVGVHDKHGLRYYSKFFFSEPCPIPETLVTADRLKDQSLARVKEMLDAAGFKHEGELVNITRTWHELLITNPAMYTYKSDKAKAMKKESTALVHEFKYTIKWFAKTGDRVEEKRKVRLSVCFDAGTGEFLCGDYLFV